MDFPSDSPSKIDNDSIFSDALGVEPKELLRGKDDILAIFDNESEIKHMKPNFNKIYELDCRGLIISAEGNHVDFVSRFFGPKCGINEDPVTGSAHTLMIPYWSKVQKKSKFKAQQLSSRGGTLDCELIDDRVFIGGSSYRYMEGNITF